MAITLLNEFEYTGAQGVSKLISPFMRPCLYFKVEGDGSITTPEAVLTINGTTDDYDFDCTYLGLNADNDYLFHLDLSDIIKYLMRNFDGTLKPDDLDMVATHGLTLFDEYFLDWSAGTIATLYFEKGTANEVTEALEPTFIYLSGQLPRASGFNLYDVLFNEQLQPLKWSATTYNAIFIWLRAALTTITNITYPPDPRVLYYGTPAAEGYYQYKFPRYCNDVALFRGLNNIRVTNVGMTTVYLSIFYDPDCQYVDVLFQHPSLGYVSYPFNGAYTESLTFKKGDEFDKFLTTLVNISTLKEVNGYEGQRRISVTGKVDSEHYPVVKELHGSRHVFLHVGSKAYPVNLVTGLSNIDYETFTASGIAITSAINTTANGISLSSNVFTVFNGEEIVIMFFLTLNSGTAPTILIVNSGWSAADSEVSADGLNVITLTAAWDGDATLRFFNDGTTTNFATSKIFVYRKSAIVMDEAINWVKCDVSGGSSFRSNRSREEVSVELMLPEHFNIKF